MLRNARRGRPSDYAWAWSASREEIATRIRFCLACSTFTVQHLCKGKFLCNLTLPCNNQPKGGPRL